jgi:hypothetical protein
MAQALARMSQGTCLGAGLLLGVLSSLGSVFLAGCSADTPPAKGSRGASGAAANGTSGSSAGLEFGNPDGVGVAGSGDTAGTTATGSCGGGTGAGAAGSGVGDPALSFIWIANAEQSTISKLNTRTLEEVGRYLTREDSAGSPSRTSVNLSGDVAVANRNGGVAKFYAKVEDCKDANGDGIIQTSTGANDVLPWAAEECRAWFTPLMYVSNRPLAWARGTLNTASCKYENEKVWTSGANNCTDTACQIDVMRMNGDTGVVEDMIPIGGLMGANFISAGLGGLDFGFGGAGIVNYGAYGGAADGAGNFWLFVSNTTQLIRVDHASLKVEIWKIPKDNGYGITVDNKGRPWVCGQAGLTRFDYTTQTFAENNAFNVGFNGCMTDGNGTIWVGGGGDGGTPGVHSFDEETLMMKQSIMVPDGVKGVSIDFDGYVWGVAKGSVASRVDPVTGHIDTYKGLTGAYSYSDMTGYGLTVAGTAPPPD